MVVFSMAFIFDVSDVSGVPINVVVHHLTASVGKHDVVLALSIISVAMLVVTQVHVGVVVLDGIVEIVFSWCLKSDYR